MEADIMVKTKIAAMLIMGLGILGVESGQAQFLKDYNWKTKAIMYGNYKVGVVKHGTTTIIDQVTAPNGTPCDSAWQVKLPSIGGFFTITAAISNCVNVLQNNQFDFVYKPVSGGGNWQTVGTTFSLADVYAIDDPDCCDSSANCAGEYRPGILRLCCQKIQSVDLIVSSGTGYNAGEILSPFGGTLCPPQNGFGFQLQVTSVNGQGGVTGVSIILGIGYTTPPGNPISFGGSAGSGFTANCTFQ